MKSLERYGPWALIAGASEGIGAAFAEQIAAHGINLILVARNQGRLDELATSIRADAGVSVRTAAVDLTEPDTGERIAHVAEGCEVGLLVFNAGARTRYGDLVDDPLDITVRQIHLNCVAPATLCRLFGAPMKARGRGGIILLGSMSGLAGAAGMAVYAAGKAFDATLAESLWFELNPNGVHVLGLIAGATATPAMERAGLHLTEFSPMTSADVAREGLANLTNGPIWFAGEGNRAAAQHIRGMSRAEAVVAMSAGSAATFGVQR
jgi:short-subunit dehydrogenase